LEHLNYCRQIIKTASAQLEVPNLDKTRRALWAHLLDLCHASTKFLLPDNGIVIDDNDLRGLDSDLELHLPYKLCALEWRHTDEPEPGMQKSSKRVVFAREHDDCIVCDTAIFADAIGLWIPFYAFIIKKKNYLIRENGKVRFELISSSPTAREEIACEAERLLGLLNALQCTNVGIEKSEPKHAGKKIKAALPFDTYHVLTIKRNASITGHSGASHRSPREHLRRGHIRRIADGKKVWVTATVVAAGRGGGVVTKDYAVRGAA